MENEVRIRSETAEDFDHISAVIQAAFGERAEVRLVEAIRADNAYLPELALVAASSDGVVGHVMISRARVRGSDEVFDIGNLSPLAVAPAHQRQGIGASLVRDVLRRADDAGLPLVVVEGDPAYYGRLGFEWSVSYGIHIDLPSWAPREAAQVYRLRAYDSSIRGAVVYASAFDVLTHD